MTIFVFDRVENIVGKGENLLLLPQCFHKDFLLQVIKKSGLCGKELNYSISVKKGILKFLWYISIEIPSTDF